MSGIIGGGGGGGGTVDTVARTTASQALTLAQSDTAQDAEVITEDDTVFAVGRDWVAVGGDRTVPASPTVASMEAAGFEQQAGAAVTQVFWDDATNDPDNFDTTGKDGNIVWVYNSPDQDNWPNGFYDVTTGALVEADRTKYGLDDYIPAGPDGNPPVLEANFTLGGTVGTPINRTISNTGEAVTSWAITNEAALTAAGLSFANGIISGTPTGVISSTHTITATDDDTEQDTVDVTFNVQQPIALQQTLWMEPQAATLGFEAVQSADAESFVHGTIGFVNAPDGKTAVNFDGASGLNMTAADNQNPVTIVDGPFTMVFAFRLDATAGTNNLAFSNGITAGNGIGFNIQNDGNFIIYVNDGGGLQILSFTGLGANRYDDDWNIAVIQFDGTSTWSVRVNNMMQSTQTHAVTLPITPAHNGHANGDFVIGNGLMGTSNLLNFNGDLRVAAFDKLCSDEEIEALLNFRRGLTYAQSNALQPVDFVMYPEVLMPTETSVQLNFKSSEPIIYEVCTLQADGLTPDTIVYTSPTITPNGNGQCFANVTGLVADTTYLVKAKNVGNVYSRFLQEFKTMPSTIDMVIGNIQCLHMGDSAFVTTGAMGMRWFYAPWNESNNNVRFFLRNGDFRYGDKDDWTGSTYADDLHTTLQDFRDADNDFNIAAFRAFNSRAPGVPELAADHSIVNNDEDSSSPVLAFGQQFFRERYPGAPYIVADAVYFDWKPNSAPLRFVFTDTISEYVIGTPAGSGTMMSVAQMNWLKGIITAAKTNQEFLIICTDKALVWRDEPTLLAHNWSDTTAQRTELANHITAQSMQDSVVFMEGDMHVGWYDVARTEWPTRRFNIGPTMHRAGVSWAGSGVAKIVTGNTQNWGRLTLAANGNDLDITVDWMTGIDPTPRDSQAFTLTQPT